MMVFIREFISRVWRGWNEFWFTETDPLPLGMFRFFFGINIFIMYFLRQAHLGAYFSAESPIPQTNPLEILDSALWPSIPLFSLVSGAPYLWHTVFLLAIFFLAIGFLGRLAAIVALILHLAFLQMNLAIVYGADIVTSFWLFYLAIGENDRAFSLRAACRDRGSEAGTTPLSWKERWLGGASGSVLTSVATRLIQIQLCIIYGYTGMEKLKGAPWWDGSAVWAVFGNSQLMIADLSFLRSAPVLVGLMTHSALLWEVYFPALVWLKPLRRYMLVFGVLFHSGIALGMGLYFFSGAMLAAYFLFLDPKVLRAKLLLLSRHRGSVDQSARV